ncbi:MAG: ABC transporter ATP-binding protein, partial [Ruthenibacterium sp.]
CYPNFDMAYAEALAEKFKLNPKKKIASLSTGFASIFRLVLALSAGTPYLLLDEPVLGLDAQNRDLFYRLLLEHYAKKPCTIVISTHLIEEIAGMIEQAVIIREGEILKNAPVEELLAEACTISGPAAAVDAFLAGKRVLCVRNLGGLKSACVQGAAEAALPAGLERTALHLQEYFISLMQEEDR